jgi:parvulin-like peptidyl-prolyl isomerase
MRFFFLPIFLCAAAILAGADFTSRVLAIVGDKAITTFDLDQRTAPAIRALPETLPPSERASAIQRIRENALNEMIAHELVYLDFKALKAKIPASIVQERLDRVIMQQANGDENRFRDLLHREHITYAEFRERVFQGIAVELLLYERTRRTIQITDEQVRKDYDEHRANFSAPPRWRVQVILLKPDGKYAGRLDAVLAELRAKLDAGADFSQLAREYSEGMNAAGGGDLGWQDSLAPALQKAVAPLQPGQVAPAPMKLGKNTYLVRLMERDGGAAPDLTPDLAEKIRERLAEAEAKKRLDDYLHTLYMKYPVKRFPL